MAPGPSFLDLSRLDTNSEIYSGVTTVWLLSTLGGSRNSNAVGIRKKDIMTLSIPKTCESLKNSNLNLPLRYASNLLYGVTLCYGRKTEFVLADLNCLQSQLQKQLLGLESKKIPITSNNTSMTTIFDGVHEYQSVVELQRLASLRNRKRNHHDPFLADDPMFDINYTRDISFLKSEKSGRVQPSNLIRQQDILTELGNGYGGDAAANSLLLSREKRAKNNSSFDMGEHSAIDFDLDLDFGDVMSEFDLGSNTSSEKQPSRDTANEEIFDLNFDAINTDIRNSELPTFDFNIIRRQGNHGSLKRLQGSSDSESGTETVPSQHELYHIRKRKKIGHKVSVLVIDDKIGLATEALRKNSSDYCKLMELENEVKRNGPKATNNFDRWEHVISSKDQPPFLQNCLQVLFVPFKNDMSNLKDDFAGLIERGRQRGHSLPSSRSSSVISTEQGRKLGPSDLLRRTSDTGNASNILSGLNQIDEELEFGAENDFNGESGDFMHIDLQLPPSSFGRTSSKVSSSSRDHIDELQRIDWKRRRPHERALDSLDNVDEECATNVVPFEQDEGAQQFLVLDKQSRKFYDYIEEHAIFASKITYSHPPYRRKLLFEDIIPSKMSEGRSFSTEAEEGTRYVDRKIAANAFLSLLQLASKNFVGLGVFSPENSFQLMNGDDIVIYI